ncbi:hypothetical protein E2C01_019678 [Portunus trituberculatus]|uniref:Uncharacterized protein n=1 Tax=Portunus trituberculatus TaxID=210409 RepID=A0A5B7DZ46_PORTR|nr:hypothetical protein [Portunus trituberculatus]
MQCFQLRSPKLAKAPPPWDILRSGRRNGTRYEIVIGGTQRRSQANNISRRIRADRHLNLTTLEVQLQAMKIDSQLKFDLLESAISCKSWSSLLASQHKKGSRSAEVT